MVQPRATSVERKRKKRKPFLGKQLPPGTLLRTFVLWMAFPAVCLVVMAILVDGCVMPLVTRHGTEFTLPDFTGQRVLEARLTLEDLDLNHEVATEEYSASQEKGVILSQIPIGGTKVKSDRIIKFVVSRGQRVVAVPDVAGLSVRHPHIRLRQDRPIPRPGLTGRIIERLRQRKQT